MCKHRDEGNLKIMTVGVPWWLRGLGSSFVTAAAQVSSLAWELPHAVGTVKKKKFKNKDNDRVPVLAQWKRIRLASMRMQIRSLASVSGLRIQRCRELWCRWQMQLGSPIAVAVA